MRRRNLLVALLSATCALLGTSFAQKQAIPKSLAKDSPAKVAIAQENVKELLLLMDTNKNGKISKQEWLKFMEAEFDRLDQNKKGELDPEELRQSRLSVGHVHFADTGK
jgi:EF hand